MIFLKGHRRLCGAKTIGRNRRLLQREDMAVTRPGRQLWSCWQVMGSGCHGLTVPAPIQAQSMWRPKLSTFLWWGSGEPGLLPCCWWWFLLPHICWLFSRSLVHLALPSALNSIYSSCQPSIATWMSHRLSNSICPQMSSLSTRSSKSTPPPLFYGIYLYHH